MEVRIGRCLVRDILLRRGRTQADLADRIGMPASQISEYVTGKHEMSLRIAKLIASELGCTIDDLYEWEIVC